MKCPNCNSEIPDDSVFCQLCGTDLSKYESKSQDTPNKKSNPIMIVAMVFCVIFGIAMLSLFLVTLNSKNEIAAELEETKATMEEQESTISSNESRYNSLESKYKSLQSDYDDLEDDYWEAEDKAYFMDRHIVFVGADGGYYHKYDCPYLDLSEFWAYNVEAARDNHKACPYCN